MKVLWLAPNFNHYKARFLNTLAQEQDVNLTILSGTGREQMGDEEIVADFNFKLIKLVVSKLEYGKSSVVRKKLNEEFNKYDWVLIPSEKKNITLFLYALWLRFKSPNTKLFSYNHPISKSGKGAPTLIDKLFSKFYYRFLDKVVFYTEASYDWALKNNLIQSRKANWANNTLDNAEVSKYYTYCFPPKTEFNILFIGRLIPSKRIDLLLNYYQQLKALFPHVGLHIIGDGPESSRIKKAIENGGDIKWYGTLVKESDIAPIMKNTSLVFIPGLSGLSINHAFMYGRPYVTLKSDYHGPEITYLNHDQNGLIIPDNKDEIVKAIGLLISNRHLLESYCEKAYEKGQYLSISNWVQQFKTSLSHE